MSASLRPESLGFELRERLAGCADHFVVDCATCSVAYPVHELAADVLAMPQRYFLCPLCGGDLAAEVLDHTRTCRRFPRA